MSIPRFLIVVALSATIANGEWVSFGKTTTKEKPQVRVLSSNNNETVIEFTIFGMEVQEVTEGNETFHKLRLPGYFTTLGVGKPQLPVITELIGIPDAAEIRATILDSTVIILDGYRVYPFQEPVFEGEKKDFIIDRTFYESNWFYPRSAVGLGEPTTWRDVRVNTLRTYPIRYNPATGKLNIYQSLTVRLEYYGIRNTNVLVVPGRPVSPEWEKIYKNAILNYEFLSIENTTGINSNILNKGITTTSSTDYDYLIITVDNFISNIKPFADFNTRKGLLTKVTMLSSIGGNDRTKIKNYITSEYNNYNIKHVLLVGDHDDLYMSTDGPGDYLYSNLAGDIKPEIAIGRISAVSTVEVDHIVSKILKYETNPPISDWVKRSLLVAHEQNAPGKYQGCKEEIRNATDTNSGTYSIMYPIFNTAYGADTSYGGDRATNADVTNSINAGKGTVNYRGHGSETAWTDWNIFGDYYTTSNARALSNGDKIPIVFSIACSNSKLDYSSECLAEAFSKANDGAVSFLGATRHSYTTPNHTYDKQLYNAIFDLGILNIGNASNYAISRTIDSHGSSGEYNAKIYLWLGDPALEIWTNTPSQYTNVTITDYGDSVSVSTGVSGSAICASSSDEGDSFYDVADNTSSHMFKTPVRPLYITVTKHNYIPYQAVTGGTFATDQTWYGHGTLYVHGDLAVAGGKKLTVSPGAKVKFAADKRLYIYGTLTADGTPVNKITFTSSAVAPAKRDWWGIKFFNSSNDASIIDNAIIEYADFSIYLSSAEPTITNNTSRNNYWGLYSYSTTTAEPDESKIKTNRFVYNTVGVCMNSSNVTLEDNLIKSNSSQGLLMSNASSPRLCKNSIKNNSDWGIGVNALCAPVFSELDWSTPALNDVSNNGGGGIILWYSAAPFIGSSDSYGYAIAPDNSIYSNTVYNIDMNSNYTGGTIDAEYVWWGVTSAPSIEAKFNIPSKVNYANWRTSLPSDAGSSLGKRSSVAAPVSEPDTNSIEWLTAWAQDLWVYDMPEKAIHANKVIIRKHPYSPAAITALIRLYQIHQQYHIPGLSNDLVHLSRNAENIEIRKLAKNILVNSLVFDEKIDEAISIANDIVVSDRKSYNAGLALFNLFHIYKDHRLDMESANRILNQMKSDHPNSEFTYRVREFMGEEVDWSLAKGYQTDEGESAEQLPISFNLRPNYPNPFNPNTTISYDLPEDANVNLVIYDILGREVIRLVDGIVDAGYKQVIWTGTDSDGRKVPSGIYIYSIQANKYHKTRKMVLLK